jgi:ribosomal protein S18 acetylase RimI-like enzyme
MTEPAAIRPVTIRPVAASDRAAWQSLFAAYGAFYETAFSPEVFGGVWGWLMDASHPVSALVAELDGPDGARVVGFAHLRALHDTFTAGPGWFLDDLYVEPEHRGQGIARALIAACEATARAAGGGTLRWITASDNLTAQALYDQVATRATWVTYEKET